MSTSAPKSRTVEAFTGTRTPIFQALSEADNFVREIADVERLRDENAELQIRVDELTSERDSFKQSALDMSRLLEAAFTREERLTVENAELAERFTALDEAYRIVLADNAALKRATRVRSGW